MNRLELPYLFSRARAWLALAPMSIVLTAVWPWLALPPAILLAADLVAIALLRRSARIPGGEVPWFLDRFVHAAALRRAATVHRAVLGWTVLTAVFGPPALWLAEAETKLLVIAGFGVAMSLAVWNPTRLLIWNAAFVIAASEADASALRRVLARFPSSNPAFAPHRRYIKHYLALLAGDLSAARGVTSQMAPSPASTLDYTLAETALGAGETQHAEVQVRRWEPEANLQSPYWLWLKNALVLLRDPEAMDSGATIAMVDALPPRVGDSLRLLLAVQAHRLGDASAAKRWLAEVPATSMHLRLDRATLPWLADWLEEIEDGRPAGPPRFIPWDNAAYGPLPIPVRPLAGFDDTPPPNTGTTGALPTEWAAIQPRALGRSWPVPLGFMVLGLTLTLGMLSDPSSPDNLAVARIGFALTPSGFVTYAIGRAGTDALRSRRGALRLNDGRALGGRTLWLWREAHTLRTWSACFALSMMSAGMFLSMTVDGLHPLPLLFSFFVLFAGLVAAYQSAPVDTVLAGAVAPRGQWLENATRLQRSWALHPTHAPWVALAHLWNADLRQARVWLTVACEAAPAAAQFWTWLEAAEGTLSLDELLTVTPPAAPGDRYRWAVAAGLAALRSKEAHRLGPHLAQWEADVADWPGRFGDLLALICAASRTARGEPVHPRTASVDVDDFERLAELWPMLAEPLAAVRAAKEAKEAER